MSLPTLGAGRLLLRAFTPADAPRVRELAGAREVASTTLNVPHPYEDGMAEAWIRGHAAAWEERKRMSLAVTTEPDGVVGAVGLSVVPEHGHGEIGYWIGVPYWGRGYATGAAGAVLGYAFGELGLHRVVARHFARNPASGRVLRKLGMTHEGTLREHFRKWGRFENLECYAVLEDEWRGRGVRPD
jgi:RimJ/RimL family protein N-acetyltransferase